jgi:molybdopterin molybdotransferase
VAGGAVTSLLSVSDALRQVLEGVSPLPEETVPLGEALHRVLAGPLSALRTSLPSTPRPWTATR